MGLKLAGELAGLTWNVRTKGDRWATAGLRGDNRIVPALDGATYRPGKRLEQLDLSLECWIVGAHQDGGMPDSAYGRQLVHERYQALLNGFRGTLGEVVDTDTGRRCWAELAGSTDPSTMAGGTRAEVDLDLTVPAGCWEDVTGFSVAATPVANGTQVTLPGAGGSRLPIIDAKLMLTPPYRNVRITEPGGQWLQFDGDQPGSSVLTIDCTAWTATLQGGSVNYLPRVRWSAASMLPISGFPGPPVLTVTGEGFSSASRLAVTGRRRWYSA